MSINYLWHSENESDWDKVHIRYWSLLRAENVPIEKKFENLDTDEIKSLSADGFYDFLHNEYFLWKYTAKNRLATTRQQLVRYKTENRMKELERIHRELLLKMRPDLLKLQEGAAIIDILKNKAAELNSKFHTDKWTPRMIDKILCSTDR